MTAGRPRRGANRAVLKGLTAYLFLAWLLVQFAPQAARLQLVAWAVVLGFPVSMIFARLLHRYGRGALAGGWAIAVVAGFVAISVPIICLQVPATPNQLSQVDSELLRMIPASLLKKTEITGGDERLKLRIRGLTVSGSVASGDADQGVELILYASVRDLEQGSELVVHAELIESSHGELIWSREYLTDPNDFRAIRRLLIRALTDGMSLTREGANEGIIV
jgi:hypothetical protein